MLEEMNTIYGSRYSRMGRAKFLKGCLLRILLGPVLHTMTHTLLNYIYPPIDQEIYLNLRSLLFNWVLVFLYKTLQWIKKFYEALASDWKKNLETIYFAALDLGQIRKVASIF